jgi:hypothetical protein
LHIKARVSRDSGSADNCPYGNLGSDPVWGPYYNFKHTKRISYIMKPGYNGVHRILNTFLHRPYPRFNDPQHIPHMHSNIFTD